MDDSQDPELVEVYAFAVRSRRCACGQKPVGFFRCRHNSTGKVVNMFACQNCLNIETKWTATRISDPDGGAVANSQLELLL